MERHIVRTRFMSQFFAFFPTPFTALMLQHPLFRLDSRRVRWVSSQENLRRFSMRVLVGVHAVFLLLWVMVALSSGRERWALLGNTNVLIALLSALSFFASIALDFVSVGAALYSINRDMLDGRWELLRISGLRPEGIAAAKHAAAQLRAWRTMIPVIGLRLAAVSLWIVLPIMAEFTSGNLDRYLDGVSASIAYDPPLWLLGLVIAATVAVVYMVEPYWRMKAMTAVGLAVSSYVLDAAMARLAGMALIVAVWISQGLILICLLVGLSFLLPFTFFSIFGPIGATGALIAAPLSLFVIAVVTGVIYGYYSLLQAWGLRRVIDRAFSSG